MDPGRAFASAPAMHRSAALDERRLRRLIEVGRGLVAELDLEAVLNRVLEVGRELTGARYAALGILDAERRELERFLTLGIDEDARQEIGNLPRGRGILGLLIEDPRPLRLEDIGDHPRSYGFPVGHPPMTTFLGVPITIRGQAFGNLYLTDKAEGAFDDADEAAVLVLAEWAAIAIENARLYESVESRRDELERAVRSLEATTEIARAVGGETELERVLELIAKRARALVEARELIILLEDGGDLVVVASAGEIPQGLVGTRLSVEGTAWGDVVRSRRPERLTRHSTRLRQGPQLEGLDATSALLVPMVFRSRPVGVLGAFDRFGQDPDFDAEDERLLLAFAASAATAVATAKSVAESRLRDSVAASEQERGRWARELHDETLQGLGALRVLLSSALRSGDPERIRTAVEGAVEEITTEIQSLRALITELRPAALDELGVQAAVESLVDRVRSVEGLEIELSVDLASERRERATRLSPEVETTVYRFVQEALTNVAKHARAERAWVEIVESDAVHAEVRDDGRGFDPEAETSGFGLVGMRERIQLADGTLEVQSGPHGTSLRAIVPVRRNAEEPRRAAAG
jgi:signal transduction histidine kinase